jgi:hypothetical protein
VIYGIEMLPQPARFSICHAFRTLDRVEMQQLS